MAGRFDTLVVQLNAASLGNYSGALVCHRDQQHLHTRAARRRWSAGMKLGERGGRDAQPGRHAAVLACEKGDAAIRTLTISNTGTAELTLDPASLVVPKGFTVIAPFAASVGAGSGDDARRRMDAAVWCPARHAFVCHQRPGFRAVPPVAV